MRVLLLGDSHLLDTHWGTGDEQLGPRLRRHGYEVVSGGIGGLTLAEALRTYLSMNVTADVAVLSFGSNDALDARGFAASYRQLLSRLVVDRRILLGPALVRPGGSGVQGRKNEVLRALDDHVRAVAVETSSDYVSLQELLSPDAHLVPDGLHFSAAAYDLLAAALVSVLGH